jgi:hypothetical protein
MATNLIVKRIGELVDAVREDAGCTALSEDNRVKIALAAFISESRGDKHNFHTDEVTGKGTIKGVIQSRRKDGKRYIYTIDGEDFSTFDRGMTNQLFEIKDGEEVELELTRKNKYENIT